MSWTDGETENRRKLEDLAGRLAAATAQAGYASGLSVAAERSEEVKEAAGPGQKPAATEAGLSVSAQSAAQQESKQLTGLLGTIANLNPIVAGLMRIFGGGNSEETAQELTKIERPDAVRYQGGVSERTGWSMGEVDYSASGMPRAVNSAAQTPVVVQVQAMDSRSFLDHRDEIASAVRQALLESHGLGDVMREV